MIRGLALTASFVLAGVVPAFAQAHPIPHTRPHPHDSSAHVPMDSAQHAALHALLHGSWDGTVASPHGGASEMHLSVAHDSLQHVILMMNAGHPTHAGAATRSLGCTDYEATCAATDLEMNGDHLRWTQSLSGKSCKATAVVSPATAQVAETMKGTMACADGEMTFMLHKKAG